jgi:hypothetical protein
MKEQRRTARAERSGQEFGGRRGKRRERLLFRTAYGGHAVAGRQHWHEVAVAAVQLPRATPASRCRLSSA